MILLQFNILLPVVPLFVNVSDTVSLHRELEHRNQLLRNQIQSVKVIYTKPLRSEGHVKIFLHTRAATDSILLRGKVSILGTNHRIVPVDLDREVDAASSVKGMATRKNSARLPHPPVADVLCITKPLIALTPPR